MSGRANRAEGALPRSGHGEVHRIEQRADAGTGCVPRPLARNGIRIEMAATGARQIPNLIDVRASVHQRDLILGRMARLDVLERSEDLGMIAERSRYRPNATHVLGVTPARVVTAAIGVRNERHAHGAPLSRREASSASNNALTNAKSSAGDGDHRLAVVTSSGGALEGPRASTRRARGPSSSLASRESGTAARYATLETSALHQPRCASTAPAPPASRQRHVSS
jgi:hypothetical protein